jgi:hypothetical protein
VDLASSSLGLSLIVLTVAIHTTAVVVMAFRLETRIRVRVDKHKPERLRAIPTVIGHIGAVALISAALHGLRACCGRRHIGGSAHSTRSRLCRSIRWRP